MEEYQVVSPLVILICIFVVVTDHIKSNELRAEYCPTKVPLADYYTELLQGSVFRHFHNLIINIQDEQTDIFIQMENS